MATSTTTSSVDFLPEVTIAGDYKKVSQLDIANYNLAFISVLNILMMEKGTNQLVPNLGEYETLLSLYYASTSDAEQILESIQGSVRTYTSFDISISSSIDTEDSSICHIILKISGVPATLKFDISKSSKYLKVMSPTLFV
jgi:hypothetical protein